VPPSKQTEAAPTPPDSSELEPTITILPTYPRAAVERKIEGQAVIRVIAFPTGALERAEIVSGDDFLTQPALEAAKQWKFKPFLKGGKPVMARAKILFDFALGDEKSGADASSGGAVKARVVESGALLPERIRVSSAVAQGLLLRKVAPVYPDEARRARVQGTVILQVIISKEGTIENLQVISADSMLVDAATDAVRQWRYRPYVLNGAPVEVVTTVEIRFTLR
jgi:TonB family protein